MRNVLRQCRATAVESAEKVPSPHEQIYIEVDDIDRLLIGMTKKIFPGLSYCGMARKIARDIVLSGYVGQCEIQIAYAIGLAEPVSVNIDCFGTENQNPKMIEQYVKDSYDLTPRGMAEILGLLEVDYNQVSSYGHFGKQSLPWEK